MKPRNPTIFETDKRRKRHHFVVTLFYADGESFSRTYTDHGKAKKFAQRQKKSPVVACTRVTQAS
jgi:hypothetical protein